LKHLLFDFLNSYHPRINLTIEVNPEKFLDTKIILRNRRTCSTEVFRKDTKITSHWSSAVPKRYKRNTINGELNRADRISSNFKKEKMKIWTKYEKAEYPPAFVKSVFRDFTNKKNEIDDQQDELLIPPDFFEIPKQTIFFEIPFCQTNEIASKRFLSKFHEFTNNTYKTSIKWITKKVKNMFTLKDKNPYPACQIYEGNCICGVRYIGETVRNVALRWKEHEDIRKDSEPAKHLKNNPEHSFKWNIILTASKNNRQRKNLEASIIAVEGPSLNNQMDNKSLLLFRNGVT